MGRTRPPGRRLTAGHEIVHRPTIKGIFVNSHVAAVRRALGEHGVTELEARLGGTVDYGDFENVPVADEVRLIEHALDLLHAGSFDPEDRAFEAGRLHFRNFTTTPWARILFTLFPRNFRYMILHAPTIAERVFRGVHFRSEPLGPRGARIVMENADYPMDHFRGLFAEWMAYFGLVGQVDATDLGTGRYEYVMRWGDVS